MADGAVQRDGAGRVAAVDRRQLLARWTADYQVLRSNGRPCYFVAVRVSAKGVVFLAAEGARPDSLLPRLAADAAFGDPTVAPAFAILVRRLITALGQVA
jgi:hypothetical protein